MRINLLKKNIIKKTSLFVFIVFLFLFINVSAFADPVNYTLITFHENADDDQFETKYSLTEKHTAEPGTSLVQLADLSAMSAKYLGYHIYGTGKDITGYEPDTDISLPAGVYSEKNKISIIFGHYADNESIIQDAEGYIINGSLVTGHYDRDTFVAADAPTVREDGSSVIAVYYARDRYAIHLRVHNENDPWHPVTETGDAEIPHLPDDPFIVKQGANLYERFTADAAAGDILRHFSAHEPSYGDELQWTWWARWKGTNDNGDPLYEIDPGNQFIAGKSRNQTIDPKHTGTVDYMEGPAYGLRDGDSSILEMWKTEVELVGINYTYYEDGQYHEAFQENGEIDENVSEEVIFTYHAPGYVKDIMLDTVEDGYMTTFLSVENPDTGEIQTIDPLESFETKNIVKRADGSSMYRYGNTRAANDNSLEITVITKDYNESSLELLINNKLFFNLLDETGNSSCLPGHSITQNGNIDYLFQTISYNWNPDRKEGTHKIKIIDINNMYNNTETKEDYHILNTVRPICDATGVEEQLYVTQWGEPTVINKADYINISVRKVWVDEDNNDRYRPNFIKINLLQDGSIYSSKCISSEDAEGNPNIWLTNFNTLAQINKNDGHYGERYVYSIEEGGECLPQECLRLQNKIDNDDLCSQSLLEDLMDSHFSETGETMSQEEAINYYAEIYGICPGFDEWIAPCQN